LTRQLDHSQSVVRLASPAGARPRTSQGAAAFEPKALATDISDTTVRRRSEIRLRSATGFRRVCVERVNGRCSHEGGACRLFSHRNVSTPQRNEEIFMNKLSLTALILGSGLAIAGTVLAGPDCHDGKDGKSGAGRMGRFDTNKDGKVTLAELVESKQSWLREVDGNKDGVATRPEIEASVLAQRTKHVSELITQQDKNKDGRISREESQMPQRWFARTDGNSDGSVTREELLSQRAGKHGAGKHAKGTEMDANSDGKIDAAEVKLSAERMLKRLDKNADGTLQGDELKWRGHGRGHGGGGHRGSEQQGTTDVPAGAQRI
jgi:Ca2+-binding EF-hand superfamily protein